jgi:S-methylmethionine-dependent homocysteine/selenocysteine methylase
MAAALAAAEIDLALIETQITIGEARIAAEACRKHQLPFAVSFACTADGHLLGGETLAAAYEALASLQPLAFLLNCIPASEVLRDFSRLSGERIPIPLGAYANTGRLLPDGTWEATDGVKPAVYAGYAIDWIKSGLKWIGGCCGTTPEHISAIRVRL